MFYRSNLGLTKTSIPRNLLYKNRGLDYIKYTEFIGGYLAMRQMCWEIISQ